MQPSPTLAAPALVAALLAWALLVPGALARHGPVARALPALLLIGGGLATVWLWLGPEAVPTDVLLVLKEGRETDVLGALSRAHPWLTPRDAGASPPLRDAVWLHLGVLGPALLLLTATALASGSVRALPAAGAVLLSPWGLHAALSETPAVELVLLTLLGAHLADARHAPDRASRALAVAGLASCTVAAATLRPEAVLIGGAVTVGVAADALRAPTLRVPGPVGHLLRLVVAVAVVTVGSQVLRIAGPALPLDLPFDPATRSSSALHRLVVDVGGFVAPGPAVLALAGVVLLAAQGWTGFAALVGLLATAKVLGMASHDGAAPYETLRYGAPLVGVLALAAVQGGATLGRQPGSRAAIVVLTTTAVLSPAFAPPGLPDHPWERIETTQVVGARWWIHLHEAYPDCLLQTVFADATDESLTQPELTFFTRQAWLGGPLGWAAPRKRYMKEVPACMRFVVGLDCNLRGVSCARETAGWRFGEELVGTWPEHNTHHGAHRQPLHLSIHEPP